MSFLARESRRPAFWIDAGVKAALLGLLLFAVLRPDLPQFEGKAMAGRALTYPIATLIVPLGWWLLGRGERRRRGGYPYALDILLTLPFLIDTAGNALDLYDTVEEWDDINHFVNWAILVCAFGQLLLRLPVGPITAAALSIGFGAVSAVVWEFAEYFTFIRGGAEEATAYTDTLADLALGLSGSVLAASLTWALVRRLESKRFAPRPLARADLSRPE